MSHTATFRRPLTCSEACAHATNVWDQGRSDKRNVVVVSDAPQTKPKQSKVCEGVWSRLLCVSHSSGNTVLFSTHWVRAHWTSAQTRGWRLLWLAVANSLLTHQRADIDRAHLFSTKCLHTCQVRETVWVCLRMHSREKDDNDSQEH